MKKLLIFLFSVLFFFQVKSQSKIYHDSLSEYSYLLFSSTLLNTSPDKSANSPGRQATGFFVKVDSLIFFVTAKHAVENDYINDSDKNNFPDSLNIYSHYSDPFNDITIPTFRNNAKNYDKEGLNNVDVYCFDVTDLVKGFRLNAFEITQLQNDFTPANYNFNKIKLFGFPESKNIIKVETIQITPPYRFQTNKFIISESFLNQIGNDRGIDYVNYEIRLLDTKVDSELAGFSGSPIFIQNSQTNKWEFLGILVAINPIRNSIYVVKRDEVIRRILKKYDGNYDK